MRRATVPVLRAMDNPLTPHVLADPVALTRALVDIESVSGDEKRSPTAVEEVLRDRPHLRWTGSATP